MSYQKAIILGMVFIVEAIVFFCVEFFVLGWILLAFSGICFWGAWGTYDYQKQVEKAAEKEKEENERQERLAKQERLMEERRKQEEARKKNEIQEKQREEKEKQREEREKQREIQKVKQEEQEREKQQKKEEKERKEQQKREEYLKIFQMNELYVQRKEVQEEMLESVQQLEQIKCQMFRNSYLIHILKAILKQEKGDTIQDKIYSIVELLEKVYTQGYNSWNGRDMAKKQIREFVETGKYESKKENKKASKTSILMGLRYYCERMDLMESDVELSTIMDNLWTTYKENEHINIEYISQKVFAIYENTYKKKYQKNVTEEDFAILFYLMEQGQNEKDDKQFELCYSLVFENYPSVKSFPKEIYDEIVIQKKRQYKYENLFTEYMIQNKEQYTIFELCEMLFEMDPKMKQYADMVKKEKERLKKKETVEKQKEKERKHKEELEKERLRLLQGDVSKESKINKEIAKKEREKEEIELGYQDVQNGYEFEEYVAKLYRRLGFTTKVTRKSGDQGADIIATRNGKRYIIQAKFYSSPVGNKAVQEIVAALPLYEADYGIVITNNTYTQSAIELAKANGIELIDNKRIEEIKQELLASIK